MTLKFKIIVLCSLVLGLLFSGCDKPDFENNKTGRPIELTVSTQDVVATYAQIGNDAELVANNCKIRCILEVIDENGALVRRMVDYTESKSKMPEFVVSVIGGETYTFIMWSDVVDKTVLKGVYEVSTAEGLKSITLNCSTEDSGCGQYAAEAFSDKKTLKISTNSKLSMTLTRQVTRVGLFLQGMWNEGVYNKVSIDYDFNNSLRNVINLHNGITSLNSNSGYTSVGNITLNKSEYITSSLINYYTFIPSAPSGKIEFKHIVTHYMGNIVINSHQMWTNNIPVKAATPTNLIMNLNIPQP